MIQLLNYIYFFLSLVTIDGTVALENSSEGASISGSSAVQHSKGRGIHVLVLSEVDGKVKKKTN